MSSDGTRSRRASPRGSLRSRLTLSLLLTVLVIGAAGMAVDYRREYDVHIEGTIASLEEQARALQVARRRIPGSAEYAGYVDDFCAQMNEFVSPGHHILVLGPGGRVIVRARHHSGEAIERALLSSGGERGVLTVQGHKLAQARLRDDDGVTIVLAQYLDHVEGILRGQLIRRAMTTAAMAVAIVLLIYLVTNRWVLRPLGGLRDSALEWSARRFSVRCKPTGPPELRDLASRFNSMAAELERHERDRTAELEKARQIQANLLPASIPSVPGLSLVADYRPAEHVAGDLYDIFELPSGKTAIVVLDVAGHGVSAALLTGVVKMSLHRRLAEQDDISQAIELVNSDLLACVSDDKFVTLCLGTWDPGEGVWTYCAPGHPGGVLLSGGEARTLEPTGPLLGVVSEAEWSACAHRLSPGDRVFLYTDGLYEAGAPAHKLGQSGLEDILMRSAEMDLSDQIALVMDDAAQRVTGADADDITIVGFEVRPHSDS